MWLKGGRTGNNLHLNIAISDLPNNVKQNEVDRLVHKAKLKVAELDEQDKVDIVVCSQMEYLIKELGIKDTNNVIWELA